MEALSDQLLEMVCQCLELKDLLAVQAMSKWTRESCSNSMSSIWGLHHLDSYASCLHDMFTLLSKRYGAKKAMHFCDYCNQRCLASTADALRYAASHNMTRMLEILLSSGADPNIPGPSQRWYSDFPLQAAYRNGHSKSILLLTDFKADVTAATQHSSMNLISAPGTCLDLAIELGAKEILNMLRMPTRQ
jgi:hypothetical protein